jgi:UPF0716 family protein affecting phage T7 exclusion
VVGYLLKPATWVERLLLFAAAVLLIKPGLLTDGAGFGLLAVTVALQRARAAVPLPQPEGLPSRGA